jgi:DMSO/TMAO reductase YedYZ molybdopterin-dependent catalytic subunit
MNPSRLLFPACVLIIGCWFPSDARSQENQQERPQIPPGQRVIEDFPILHIGSVPDLTRDNWSVKVRGEVDNKIKLDWEAFAALESVRSVSDFHCVTGWTHLDNHWKGVRIRDLIALAHPKSTANHITFKSYDGYTTSLSLDECTGDDDILAFEWEDKPIEADLGGPVRVIIPGKYGYKGALWIKELVLTEEKELGYWEKKGYSDSADPWKGERFRR